MVTQEIYVESAAALSQALSLAQGGEVFVLAPGDYGALHISGQDFGPAGITIQSADPDDPAVFSRLSVYHSSDIAFAHVSFDYIAQPDAAISTPVTQITGSENISFAHSSFLGDPAISRDPGDHGYGAGFGLRVRDSRGILVEESDFSGLLKGIHIADSQDILLQSNEISQFRSDGINLVNVQNAQVLDNYIHSPARSFLSDDHPDMIQMWSSAETPEEMSRDVTIKGNLLDIGSGDYAQGLYISNRSLGRDGEAFIYKNFLIEENVIIGDHSNGLRVGPVDGLVITGNTLLHMRNETAPNPFNKPPQILLEGPSQNVTLTDNLAGRITADDTRPGWEVSGNIALAAADYGLHFAGIDPAAPPQSMADVLDAYRLVPESPLAGQVGSELLWPLPEPEPEPTLPPPPPPDPALSLVGGRDDDQLTGGAGDDTLLLRFGQDSALGGAGADTFVLDWRYLDEGDAHHIADLDFAESDQILLRFLNGSTITIPSQEALERFLESDAAQITQDGALYIQDHEGRGLSLHLEDIPLPPPPPPAPPPEPGQKLIAGRKDDQLTGGAGDDTLLLRFGQDSALGGTGADTFVLDWRYLNEGDAHHIADLDFAEGDRLVLRFFNGGTLRIASQTALNAFLTQEAVSVMPSPQDSAVAEILLQIEDEAGQDMRLSLSGESLWEIA